MWPYACWRFPAIIISMTSARLKTWLLIIYLGFWGGAIGVLGKLAFPLFSPIQLIFVRIVITLAVFSGFLFFKGRLFRSSILVFKHIAHFIFLGATGVFAAMILGFAGLKLTTAIHYDLLFNLSAVFIAVFSFLFFHENIKIRDLFLFVIALLGTFFIVTNGNFNLAVFEGGSIKGDLLVLAAAGGWGLYSVLGGSSRKRHPELSPLLTVFGSFLIAAITLTPYILVKAPLDFSKILNPDYFGALFSALLLSLAATAFLFMLWFRFIEKSGGLMASFVALSENVGGVIFPILILGESLTFWTALGGVLIVIPIILQEYLSSSE